MCYLMKNGWLFFCNILLVQCGCVVAAEKFLVKLRSPKKNSWSLMT